MLDAYLEGVNYFRLLLANDTSLTSLDSAHRLAELPVPQHGVTAEVSSSSDMLAAVMFGRSHFDVFGWFLPMDLPSVTLEAASQTLCEVYRRSDMAVVVRGPTNVTQEIRWNASVDQHLTTLDRFVRHRSHSKITPHAEGRGVGSSMTECNKARGGEVRLSATSDSQNFTYLHTVVYHVE